MVFLGWMVGFVVLGKIIDMCCKLWSFGCYGKGVCVFYDIEDFWFKKYFVEILVKCVVVFLYGVCIWVLRNRIDWSIDDDKDKEEKDGLLEKENLMNKFNEIKL